MRRRRSCIRNVATDQRDMGCSKSGAVKSPVRCFSCGEKKRGGARIVEVYAAWSYWSITICVACAWRVGVVAESGDG